MPGGGGGESGGMVVGGPTPDASILAGVYQANAAQQANQYAQEALNKSLSMLNRQYQQARYDVQPYRTQGVQALNQLNQYLQLNAYNPGSAPTAVTMDSERAKVTNEQIKNYIGQNVGYTPVKDGRNFGHYTYTGVGSDNPELNKIYDQIWSGTGLGTHGITTLENFEDQGGPNAASWFMKDPNQAPGSGTGTMIMNAVKDYLAKQSYDSKIEGYTRDLEEYNQNKAMYDQYTAQGKLTSAQIQDKIANLPGYQAELAQGIDAIQKNAASRGYLGSGRVLKELGSYGQGTLSKFYGNELSRLSQLAGGGQQAAQSTAQNSMGTGQLGAGLYQQYGETAANSSLASGNALAQAILAANQQYKIIGGGGGGGGLGGLGGVLSGIGSIASAFSSKTLKESVSTPSTKEILARVNELNIDKWKYKNIDRVHIGPYAEDVMNKLGIGDGKSINLIDLVGILFASVQELSKKLDKIKLESKHA